jgi:hypothetical protein
MAGERDRLRRLAKVSGISSAELRRYMEMEAVTLTNGEVSTTLVRRLRRIRRLRKDLSLSVDAVVIILRLLDRIEAVEEASPPKVRIRVF